MIAWKRIDTAILPDGRRMLHLMRRGDEFSIRGDGFELMNSRMHGSEEVLARLVCQRLTGRSHLQLLIGGLGMGYTLAAALDGMPADGRVTVAELVPAVVAWNRGPLAHLAGRPLADERVNVREIDVAVAIHSATADYDAIVLDVDNGPDGLTRQENGRLYGSRGLAAVFAALRPAGVLGVWSAGPDNAFAARLRRAGFSVETIRAAARGRRGGGRHTIWLATRSRKDIEV